MKDNLYQIVLNFKTLRRFNYSPRLQNVNYSVSARSTASKSYKHPLNSCVIALDADGNELGRTYYVVYLMLLRDILIL